VFPAARRPAGRGGTPGALALQLLHPPLVSPGVQSGLRGGAQKLLHGVTGLGVVTSMRVDSALSSQSEY
jgi:hypothetical protein